MNTKDLIRKIEISGLAIIGLLGVNVKTIPIINKDNPLVITQIIEAKKADKIKVTYYKGTKKKQGITVTSYYPSGNKKTVTKSKYNRTGKLIYKVRNYFSSTTKKQTNSIVLVDRTKTASNIYKKLKKPFWFMSGAGGWGTKLQFNSDGSFTGLYIDSDMGVIGPGYPNGSEYRCQFSGKFSKIEKVSQYVYKLTLGSLKYDKPGVVTIENGIRITTATPYGLDNAKIFYLYLKDMPTSQLPYGFVSWASNFGQDMMPNKVPYYGLYNVGGEEGFLYQNY